MSAEILKPFGEFGVPSECDPDIVSLLEKTLEKARAGEVAGIAMVVIMPNGWIKADVARGNRATAEMLGAAGSLYDDIMREWKSS